jgi:hypothetical protein
MPGIYSGRSVKLGKGNVFLPRGTRGKFDTSSKRRKSGTSKFDNIPSFRKNAGDQIQKSQKGIMKGLIKIRKSRNIGTVNNYLWDKSM